MNLLKTIRRALERFENTSGGSSRSGTTRAALTLDSLDGRCLPSATLLTTQAVAVETVSVGYEADTVSIKHDPAAQVVTVDTALPRKHDPS